MKRFFVASVVCAGALVGVKANAYNAMTPGDIVVYRVGDGSAIVTNNTASVAVFLDEYTPSGTLVQSIPMPTAASGPDAALTAGGASTAEGLITLEADGANIVVTGFGTAPGTAAVDGTASATVPRVVGLVDVTGVNGVDTTTQLGNVGTYTIRSAASDNGNNIWTAGGNVGLLYSTLGSTTASANIAGGNSGPTNLRQVNIINGQLMVGDQSGSAFRLATVGTGLPTTTGQLMANLPGTTGGNPTSTYAYVQLHLAGGPAGNNTMYVADDLGSVVDTNNAGPVSVISKWSLVGGTWVKTGEIPAPVARGVAAHVDASGNVDVFFTDGSSQFIVPFAAGNISNLNLAVDSSGYDGTFSGTSTVIANVGGATGTESFRGIVIVPVPEPSTVVLVGAGVLGMVAMRRRRRS